jgi:hypothetical protein
MQTRQKTLSLVLTTAILLLIAGCKEFTITTRVLPDGSLERSVAVDGDSNSIVDTGFPVLLDSTWTILQTVEQNKEKDGKLDTLFTIRKKFRRAADLNRELAMEDDTIPRARVTVKLIKSFRWFHTFYTYRETVHAFSPFTKLSITDYLTEDEMDMLFSEEDTLKLEEKYEDFQERNFFEEFYMDLLDKVQKRDIPGLTEAMIQSKKDELFQAIIEATSEDYSDNKIIKACYDVFQTDAVWELKEDIIGSLKRIEKTIESTPAMGEDAFTHVVQMPGLIIDSNAGKIEGNTVAWFYRGEKAAYLDYEMWVQSRMVNRWTIYATIMLLVVIGLILLLSAIRHRRK